MNDDSLPLYPGTEQTTSLTLQKMSETPPVESPKETASAPSVSSTVPVFTTRHVAMVGPENSLITCPFCQTMVRTTIRHTTTTRTHTLAMQYWLCCCCCIPYCSASTRNTDHYCPACLKFIGTYEK